MNLNVLFSADKDCVAEFTPALRASFASNGLSVELSQDHAPETVDYIVFAPNQALTDFAPFTRTKAVLGLWAGVERIVGNPTLTQPLCRMVDSGLREGMVEWVCGHVLRYHLGMDEHLANPDRLWSKYVPPLARNRRVCILGLGELGSACASALAALNFDVSGWSRSSKSIDNVRCMNGDSGLDDTLASAEILVLLLPLTDQTENLMDAHRLAQMPNGARIINPGRGPLIDDEALIDALDSGHIDHATLDVFRVEPLPKDHFFWAHPRITVTPHVASDTRPETAAEVITDNIIRAEAGKPLRFLVDRQAGY